MRELDGLRIIGPGEGRTTTRPASQLREIVSAADTGQRWSFGEVRALPDERVGTHVHPGEPELILIVEGDVELHGSTAVTQLHPGDAVFIPPDTEHGIRAPRGGRWLAVWPVGERQPGPRYRGE